MMTRAQRANGHVQLPGEASIPTIGVLLVHGLNGGRHDMVELEAALHAEGLLTSNILLPGHGPNMREELPVHWQDWTRAVSSELAYLRQQSDMVFLVGHSLGGALALYTAAHEEVAGVVAMCAPLQLYPMAEPLVRVVKNITPFLPVFRDDVHDPVARRLYQQRASVPRWVPMQPVESLLQFLPHLRLKLPEVTVPVLIMAAGHDHIVPVRDSHEIYRCLGSREKHFVTFQRSSHVLMKDYDREAVYARTSAFIKHLAHGSQSVAQS